MAKQTFTVGQVLTAAQVTALQTNGYNQTVSTKTASYVLVAADVGTRVYMNAAGATTITVNTGMFAAGDTLWIGNIGAGACVVTAGTATVDKFSTASLTISQYQSAVLYFTSTGVSILYSDSAGASTPLTTKGDLFTYDTANQRLGVGANNTILTADSTAPTGIKWATAASSSYTWTTWTPALKQSASVSYTNRGSKYVVVDKLFIGKFILQISSAGTANNQMYLSLPVAFPAPYNTLALGVVNFYDASSASSYTGQIVGTGSSSPDDLAFTSGLNKTTDRWGLTGSDAAVALASGDFVSGTIIVELT